MTKSAFDRNLYEWAVEALFGPDFTPPTNFDVEFQYRISTDELMAAGNKLALGMVWQFNQLEAEADSFRRKDRQARDQLAAARKELAQVKDEYDKLKAYYEEIYNERHKKNDELPICNGCNSATYCRQHAICQYTGSPMIGPDGKVWEPK